MKININPEKELFKWGPIEFRQIYGSGFLNVILSDIRNNYPWPWPPSLSLCKDSKMLWINEKQALCNTGLKYFKAYLLNLKKYKNHWNKYNNWIKEFRLFAKKIDKTNFKEISDRDLVGLLDDFTSLVLNFWLIVHVPEIANWGGEYLLRKELAKISEENADKYLEILSASVKLSFFQQEELDLLECKPDELDKHAKNYRWLLNSYGGNRVLRVSYFKNKLKGLIKDRSREQKINEIRGIIGKHKQRKEDLSKKLKLNKKIISIYKQLSQAIWWQDHRKSYIWRMNYYWDKFLEEISRRTGWKMEELQYCWHDEVKKIAKGKKIDKQVILKRKKYYALYTEGGKTLKIDNGNEVRRLFYIYENDKISKNEEIKGLAVSEGLGKIIKGQVRIISNPFKEGKKMKAGDVLVASMTSPEFIIIMKRAKAIITDHGGVTSHAAIVSRELNIPCIVGTKIATKVLKDGDWVEVDANKGVVKVIKKLA